MQITLKGKASGRDYVLKVLEEHLDLSLLDFLRSQNITIASSCSGEGVCKKCVIQDGILSCEIKVKEFLKKRTDGFVFVDYL